MKRMRKVFWFLIATMFAAFALPATAAASVCFGLYIHGFRDLVATSYRRVQLWSAAGLREPIAKRGEIGDEDDSGLGTGGRELKIQTNSARHNQTTYRARPRRRTRGRADLTRYDLAHQPHRRQAIRSSACLAASNRNVARNM
jgi:hypothetical protein